MEEKKRNAKLKEIRAALDRLDLDHLSPDERWTAFMEWVKNSRGYGWVLLDILMDGQTPLSKEERDKLDQILGAAESAIQNVRRFLKEGTGALEGSGDITGDIDEANTGDLLSMDVGSQDIKGETGDG